MTPLDLDLIDLHDKASDIWDALHPNFDDAEFFDCRLCGGTIYPSIDYTHAEDCPYRKFGAAIDVFAAAVKKASQEPVQPPND